jgi:hypothetical protein
MTNVYLTKRLGHWANCPYGTNASHFTKVGRKSLMLYCLWDDGSKSNKEGWMEVRKRLVIAVKMQRGKAIS